MSASRMWASPQPGEEMFSSFLVLEAAAFSEVPKP